MPVIELSVMVQANILVHLPDTYTVKQAHALGIQATKALNAGKLVPCIIQQHMPTNDQWSVDREATGEWEMVSAY